MSETKKEKFQRLSLARMAKALHAIRVVGNLGSGNYEYSRKDAEGLVRELNEAVEAVAARLGVEAPAEAVRAPQTASGASPKVSAPKTDIADVPTAKWALEMLQRKEYDDAKIMLKRAIQKAEGT
jgi:hypothetical protein